MGLVQPVIIQNDGDTYRRRPSRPSRHRVTRIIRQQPYRASVRAPTYQHDLRQASRTSANRANPSRPDGAASRRHCGKHFVLLARHHDSQVESGHLLQAADPGHPIDFLVKFDILNLDVSCEIAKQPAAADAVANVNRRRTAVVR